MVNKFVRAIYYINLFPNLHKNELDWVGDEDFWKIMYSKQLGYIYNSRVLNAYTEILIKEIEREFENGTSGD